MDIIYNSNRLNLFQKYWLLSQVTSFMFRNPQLDSTKEIKKLEYMIYNDIYEKYIELFYDINWINKNKRDESLVFVTIQQFMNLNHAPTKTALDRARVLKQKINKAVIIINTAEMLGGEEVPLAVKLDGNYNANLMNIEEVEYEGEIFPYIQFDKITPNRDAGELIVEFVKNYRPAYIVNIGGNSLMMDVCAKLVPVLNVNTVPSNITYTHATA